MENNLKKFAFGIGLFVLLLGFVNAATFEGSSTSGYSSNAQYNIPSFSSLYSSSDMKAYWPILSSIENGNCSVSSDFIVAIPPGGCHPMVVRSDLLEEQNVPVFCQLSAIKINPLIKVSSIKSITFKGNYPEGVAGITFHPARAAVQSHDVLLGSPLLENIGYAVIILKQNQIEKNMPERILGNLTAVIRYDAEEAFGVGKSQYYLPVMSEDEWDNNYTGYGFWYGKGFVRVLDVDGEQAKIALYTDKDHMVESITLKLGETSRELFFPGFYCKAKLQVKLNAVDSAEDKAKLLVDGQEMWVRAGSKVLDSCTVKSVSPMSDGTGSVLMSCPGSSSFTLSLMQKSILYNENSIKLGENVSVLEDAKTGKGTYLAYAGQLPDSLQIKEKNKFIVLIDTTAKVSINSLTKYMALVSKTNDKRYNKIEDYKKAIESAFGNNAKFVQQGAEFKDFDLGLKDKDLTKSPEQDTNMTAVEEYWKNIEELGLQYEKTQAGEYYGEQALWNVVESARLLGQQTKESKYLEKLVEIYPTSKSILEAKERLSLMGSFDASNAGRSVYFNNKAHFISVSKFIDVTKSEKSVRFNIPEQAIGEGEKVCLGSNPRVAGFASTSDTTTSTNPSLDAVTCGDDPYLIVDKINTGNVKLRVFEKNPKNGQVSSSSTYYTLYDRGYGEQTDIQVAGKTIFIADLISKQEASVSLLPVVDNTKTEANFTFNIAIEKRNIQLSPEKTKQMLSTLNKTIERWDAINARLTKMITGLKGACFATSAVLMASNFVSSLDGKSIARQKAMEYYKTECTQKVADGLYPTRSACYASKEYNDKIESSVNGLTTRITDWDALAKPRGDEILQKGGLFGDSVANETAIKNRIIASGQLPAGLDSETAKGMTLSELREYYLYKGVATNDKDKSFGSYANTKVDAMIDPIKKRIDDQKELEKSINGKTAYFKDITSLTTKTTAVSMPPLTEDKFTGLPSDVSESVKAGNAKLYAAKVGTNGQNYLFVLKKSDGQSGAWVTDKVYKVDSTGTTVEGTDVWADLYGTSQKGISNLKGDEKTLFNYGTSVNFLEQKCVSMATPDKYKNPQVKYYQASVNKFLPAIVPVRYDGYYARMSQGVGGMLASGVSSYQSSGAVTNFYLCHVGPNGLEENMQGDDVCTSMSTLTAATTFGACNLPESEVKKLKDQAIIAIQVASENYGKTSFKVPGYGSSSLGTDIVSAGITTSLEGEVDCEQFMSADQCNIMFNVCDPVVCPTSRCNLGGKFTVPNVVQSGIIGSLVLCLPNFGVPPTGVIIPVCLTGVNAGIESYVSILKSEQSCLQESLDSGKHVGICDEITSIQLCEFFWRQLSPVMKVLVSTVMSSAYGGPTTKGGGEYLTAQAAWDNTQKAIDYFKNTYAQNTFNAFKFRSVEDLGSEFCKANLGSSLPNEATLDSLLEPESPPQFYAQFDEIEFTDATVPATSQYKVYFHVYAGKDKGVQYSVYLKNPPESAYYRQNPYVTVKSGFIAKGDQKDEAVDFTAPAGYKELCVLLDAQTYCGFKSVTTSFGVNYVKEKYVEGQAKEESITTEKGCISGTPSVLGMANLNVQAGAEDSINPNIAANGIVRICATGNPGTGIDSARWKNVGYCGNSNIGCWLDTNSVADKIKTVMAVENKTVAQTLNTMDSGERATSQTVTDAISKARQNINELSKTSNLIKITDSITSTTILQGASNLQKAEIYTLLVGMHRRVIESMESNKALEEKKKEAVDKTTLENSQIAQQISEDTGVSIDEIANTPSSCTVGLDRDVKSLADNYGVSVNTLLNLNPEFKKYYDGNEKVKAGTPVVLPSDYVNCEKPV